jgi:hypothetical protein
MDPITSIMGAIKDQESGGDYNSVNQDSGAFGAYQFMPSTWNGAAQSAGVNPNDTSPQNQDKVAYSLMSQYYNQYGQDPRAVASMWYSGQPDYTVNSSEGNYPSVNGYVNSVMSKLNGGNTASYAYSPHDANGKPIMNIMATLVGNNAKEPFQQQSIMNILGTPNPTAASAISQNSIFGPDYSSDLLKMNPDVAKYVQPTTTALDTNTINDIKDNIARQAYQNNLQKATGVLGLIKNSQNIDNRNAYAALAGLAGLKVPSGSDQIMSDKDLFQAQQQQSINDRTYNLNKSNLDWEHDFKNRSLDQAMQIANMKNEQAKAVLAAKGANGGKPMTPDNVQKYFDMLHDNYTQADLAASNAPDSDTANTILQNAVRKGVELSYLSGDQRVADLNNQFQGQTQQEVQNRLGADYGGANSAGNNSIWRFFGGGYKDTGF